MIEESILDQWATTPEKVTREQLLMLIGQLKTYQRNSTVVYVFPQSFFDVSNNKLGTPDNATITPEKLRGFVLEKAVNADYYFAANTRIMPQDAPPILPPTPTPAPLYKAQATADYLNLRDASGSATDAQGEAYGAVKFGDVVEVWELLPQAGDYIDRAVITPKGRVPQLNVWNKYLMKIEE